MTDAAPFAFNFALGTDKGQPPLTEEEQTAASASRQATAAGSAPAEEVPWPADAAELLPQAAFASLDVPGVVGTLRASSLWKAPENSDSNNDPAGGFKIWECSLDLAAYLATQYAPAAGAAEEGSAGPASRRRAGGAVPLRDPLRGLRVLELGCGAGVPGLVALRAGAALVHFQDYNRDVLEQLTLPNVVANRPPVPNPPEGVPQGPAARMQAGAPPGDARFFSGEWAAVADLLAAQGLAGSYDLVLTAETIYSPEAQPRLLRCIEQCLRPGTGEALVAAKSYYFGVGGGTEAFRGLVEAGGKLAVERASQVDDGSSNKREVLRLRWAQIAPP